MSRLWRSALVLCALLTLAPGAGGAAAETGPAGLWNRFPIDVATTPGTPKPPAVLRSEPAPPAAGRGADRRSAPLVLSLAGGALLLAGASLVLWRRGTAKGDPDDPDAPVDDHPEVTAVAPSPAARLSLSSADEAALTGLPGVGPGLAARIVEWRRVNGRFETVDQLREIPGIGEARLEALRPHVVA